ncbi:unnamed protein product [Allacma fusca]|uniref:SID1 transmembrane family member 1 n=1 Tax=Allacma fusca TaxID=39272 RepID=A0A8J2J605_9HEXA|nr:unnamed protein product [Allacma fusca]
MVTFRSALIVNDSSPSFAVSKTTCHLHVLDLKTAQLNNTVSVHLETTTAHQKDEVTCPMVFSLTQSKSTKSWALPLLNETTKEDNITIISHEKDFTICLEHDNKSSYANGSGNNVELLLFVSTCNPSNVNYTVKFTLKHNIIIGLNENSANMYVIPTTLYHFRFNFPYGVDRVIVEVQSEDQVCMTVAIQCPWCRLLNENSLSHRDQLGMPVGFKSILQDMSKKAVLRVDKTDFSEGFFIVFMVQPNDRRCGWSKNVTEKSGIPLQAVRLPEPTRIKIINVTVHGVLSTSNYTMPLLFPLAYVIVIIVITTATYGTFNYVSVRTKMLDFRI